MKIFVPLRYFFLLGFKNCSSRKNLIVAREKEKSKFLAPVTARTVASHEGFFRVKKFFAIREWSVPNHLNFVTFARCVVWKFWTGLSPIRPLHACRRAPHLRVHRIDAAAVAAPRRRRPYLIN